MATVTIEEVTFDLHEPDEWHDSVLIGVTYEPDGTFGPSYMWSFQDPDDPGRDMRVWTSPKFGPRAKLPKFIAGMIGRDVQVGETFDFDDFAGMECQIFIEHYTKEGESHKSEKITKVRAKKGAKPSKGAAKVPDTTDDMPF